MREKRKFVQFSRTALTAVDISLDVLMFLSLCCTIIDNNIEKILTLLSFRNHQDPHIQKIFLLVCPNFRFRLGQTESCDELSLKVDRCPK